MKFYELLQRLDADTYDKRESNMRDYLKNHSDAFKKYIESLGGYVSDVDEEIECWSNQFAWMRFDNEDELSFIRMIYYIEYDFD